MLATGLSFQRVPILWRTSPFEKMLAAMSFSTRNCRARGSPARAATEIVGGGGLCQYRGKQEKRPARPRARTREKTRGQNRREALGQNRLSQFLECDVHVSSSCYSWQVKRTSGWRNQTPGSEFGVRCWKSTPCLSQGPGKASARPSFPAWERRCVSIHVTTLVAHAYWCL